jgi:hypothetical protein
MSPLFFPTFVARRFPHCLRDFAALVAAEPDHDFVRSATSIDRIIEVAHFVPPLIQFRIADKVQSQKQEAVYIYAVSSSSHQKSWSLNGGNRLQNRAMLQPNYSMIGVRAHEQRHTHERK